MMFIMVISSAMMVLLNANDSRCNNLCVMRIQSLCCDIPGLTVPLASMLLDNISSFDDPRNISLLEIKFLQLCWVQVVRFLMPVRHCCVVRVVLV